MLVIEIQDTTHAYCKKLSIRCKECSSKISMTQHRFASTMPPRYCPFCYVAIINMDRMTNNLHKRISYHRGFGL